LAEASERLGGVALYEAKGIIIQRKCGSHRDMMWMAQNEVK